MRAIKFVNPGLIGAAVVAAATVAATPVEAQQVCRVRPPVDVSRIVVTTFRSTAGPELGVRVADEIRDRLGRDYSCRDMLVTDKRTVDNALESSGYRTDLPLSPTDARELARILRADEYIIGSVSPAENGYRVEAQMVLTRDHALVQPLITQDVRRLDDAARSVSRELEAARRQLAAENRCVDALRNNNNEEAVRAAQEGIAAYPQATLARICLATAYSRMNLPPDSVLRVTDEILRIDPRSRMALELAAQEYEERGDDERSVQTWTRLISLDPTNARLVERATAVLVRSGNAAAAKPIIEEAVAQNPGDPALQRLHWLVLLTIQDWKEAIEVGETLLQSDTAAADTVFFQRLVTAYLADTQPQSAAETAARGIAKFPNNAQLHLIHAQALRSAGQLQQALAAARRAVEIEPRVSRGYVQIAQIHMELEQPDSAVEALSRAVRNGEDSTFVSQYALSIGNNLYRQANASKETRDFQNSARFVQLSDRISPSPQAKFLLGVASFSIGQQAAQDAPRQRSCELARLAQRSFATANENIRAGGSVNPDAAAQYMQYLRQAIPVVENQVRQLCR